MNLKKTFAIMAVVFCVALIIAIAGNEITTSIQLFARKGYSEVEITPSAIQSSWSSGSHFSQTITVNTNGTVLTGGEVSVPGWFFVRNISTSGVAFVSVSGVPLMKLQPGSCAILPLSSDLSITSLTARAESYDVSLYYVLLGE